MLGGERRVMAGMGLIKEMDEVKIEEPLICKIDN